MKIKKGTKKVALPPVGELYNVVLRLDSKAQMLIHLTPIEELARMRKKADVLGRPMYAALARGADELHIWPAPDRSMELKVVYYPPLQEI